MISTLHVRILIVAPKDILPKEIKGASPLLTEN
jgi:hypothetical protein